MLIEAGIFGGGVTNDEGKFPISYSLPPCPGVSFSYITNTYLELYWKRFNPRVNPSFHYYTTHAGCGLCNGFGQNPLLGPSFKG